MPNEMIFRFKRLCCIIECTTSINFFYALEGFHDACTNYVTKPKHCLWITWRKYIASFFLTCCHINKNKQSQTLTKITFVSQILLCIFQLHRDILSVNRHRVFDYLCVKTNIDGYIYYDIYVEEVNPYNQITSIKCNIFNHLTKISRDLET